MFNRKLKVEVAKLSEYTNHLIKENTKLEEIVQKICKHKEGYDFFPIGIISGCIYPKKCRVCGKYKRIKSLKKWKKEKLLQELEDVNVTRKSIKNELGEESNGI